MFVLELIGDFAIIVVPTLLLLAGWGYDRIKEATKQK